MDRPTPAPVAPPSTLRTALGRNVIVLTIVSFLTDASSEMIYPLLPLFLTGVLGATPTFIGAIEGAAESVAALLKLASGWWSDRVRRRKPLVVAGYALASLVRPLVAVAQTAGQVLAIRVTDRVGKGIRGAPRDALIADSVAPEVRGRAFGVHRAGDHAGAVAGPLLAFALLTWGGWSMREVFALAAVPGVLAVVVLVGWVREAGVARGAAPRPHHASNRVDLPHPSTAPVIAPPQALPRRFWALLSAIFLFTLGNSTDAFLLLRARDLGVPVALAPVLWVLLHIVKSASSTPGGALSDRVGRRPVLVAGWTWYALVYLGFAFATTAAHAWMLFALYGIFFGLSEGAERALVADLVPPERRGAAFGWFNLAIGLAALPASLAFGAVWTRFGAPSAFTMGAGIAVAAALVLLVALRNPPATMRPG